MSVGFGFLLTDRIDNVRHGDPVRQRSATGGTAAQVDLRPWLLRATFMLIAVLTALVLLGAGVAGLTLSPRGPSTIESSPPSPGAPDGTRTVEVALGGLRSVETDCRTGDR